MREASPKANAPDRRRHIFSHGPRWRARADIFQWEYINPADPSQGKQQSTTLAPDGAGVDAVPGADLTFHDLTMAYLNGADLSNATLIATSLRNASLNGVDLFEANLTAIALGGWYEPVIHFASDLTSADLSQANLRNASFTGAVLTYADFTGADVRGAKFNDSCAFFVLWNGDLTLAALLHGKLSGS